MGTTTEQRGSMMSSETILKSRDLCVSRGARFLLVYIPSKEHVYLPYINNAETLASFFADVPALELDKDGFFRFNNQELTPELISQHMGDQNQLFVLIF